jgi:CheY-like chemotaxis protein
MLGVMAGTDPPILIVDDDPDSRGFLETLLNSQGYQVATATDGEEALAVAQEQRPRLILLDLMMPGMDGFAFRAAQLRDPDLAQTPVILISAIDDEDQIVRRVGPVPAVPKPIDVDELLDRVSAYCDHAGA